jgi:hypothetical protein
MSLIRLNLHSLRDQIRLVLSLLRPEGLVTTRLVTYANSCRTLGKLQFYH